MRLGAGNTGPRTQPGWLGASLKLLWVRNWRVILGPTWIDTGSGRPVSAIGKLLWVGIGGGPR